MKLLANYKQYLTALVLILFSLGFNACVDDIFGPERDDPVPEDQNDGLWTVKYDGSGLAKVTTGGNIYSFLPGSNKIFYTSRLIGSTGLNVVNLDGSGRTLIGNSYYLAVGNFSFSPDNSKLLLTDVYHGLYELDTKTLSLNLIIENGNYTSPKGSTDHNYLVSACYSNDMTKIVYQDSYGINVMNVPVNGQRLTIRKTSDSLELHSPAFTFNDTRVIYIARDKMVWTSNRYYLHSYSLTTGTDSVLIGPDSIAFYNPYFEAIDGNRIVCTVLENKKCFIKVISLSGNSPTVTLGEGEHFTLSPKKDKVFIYNNYSFSVINPDGTDGHMIYAELGDKVRLGMPALSFDGNYIVFGRTE